MLTAQEELVILGIQAVRGYDHLQTMIGMLVSEIAYKTSLAGNPSFIEITERVKRTMSEAELYQPVIFDWVRRQLSNEGVAFSAPGMFFLRVNAESGKVDSGPRPLRFQPPSVQNGFPGTYVMRLVESPKEIKGELWYRKDLESTIQSILFNFRRVITTIISDPEKKLHDFLGSD